MVKAGAVPGLIQMLEMAQPDGQYAAAAALYNLAGQQPQVRLAITACRALPPLVSMLQADSWSSPPTPHPSCLYSHPPIPPPPSLALYGLQGSYRKRRPIVEPQEFFFQNQERWNTTHVQLCLHMSAWGTLV